MKKVISILLVLTLAIGLAAIPVFASTYGLTEKQVTKVISHPDEILGDNLSVSITVTLTGVYSKTENYSVMNSISATKSGSMASYIRFQYSTSGNKAYLTITDPYASPIRTFEYTINTSGSISRTNIIVH